MQAAAILPSIPKVQAPLSPPDEPAAEAKGFADVMDQTDASDGPATSDNQPSDVPPEAMPVEGEAPTVAGASDIGRPPPYWPGLPSPLPAPSPAVGTASVAPLLAAVPEGVPTDGSAPDARQVSTTPTDALMFAQPAVFGPEASGSGRVAGSGPLNAAALREMAEPEALIARQEPLQIVAQPAIAAAAVPAQGQVPAFWSLHLSDPVARFDETLPADIETISTSVEGGELAALTAQPVAAAMPLVDGSSAPVVLAAPQPTTATPGSAPPAAGTPGTTANTPATPALPASLPNDLAALISARPDGPVDLQLFPEELGHLRLSLTQDGDLLRVTIQAERAETLDLLRRHSDTLMDEIRMAGFSGGSFSFSGWQGAAPDARQAPENASLADPAAPPPQPATRLAHSGLDLRL
jgi:flagellar hook-length control protein FliK